MRGIHRWVTGEFPSQRPVTQSFDVFIDLRLNKRLRKQSRRRWFETPSPSLWRHRNEVLSWTAEVSWYLARTRRPWLWSMPSDQQKHIEFYSRYHYDDVIMTMLASQITSLTVVYSIVYSGVDQSKHQSSASLAFVQEIHRGPVNFPHKWPVTRKMFPFDDVIMIVDIDSLASSGDRPSACTVIANFMYLVWHTQWVKLLIDKSGLAADKRSRFSSFRIQLVQCTKAVIQFPMIFRHKRV